MGTETQGFKLLTRCYFFVPAIALALAGLPFGALAVAVLTWAAQPLYGWGAWAALATGRTLTGQRLLLAVLVLLTYGIAGGLLVGGPMLAKEQVREPIFLAAFGVGVTVLALLAMKQWPLLAMPWALADEPLTAGGGSGFGAARREGGNLTAGDMERVLEGLPATVGFLAVTLLPILLPFFGMDPASPVYLWAVAALAVIVAPWAHGRLILLALDDGETSSEQPAWAVEGEEAQEPEPAEDEAPLGAVAAAGAGDLHGLRELADEGADLEAMVGDRTPLIAAVTAPGADRQAMLTWLVERGVNLDAVDSRGRTALHHAAIENDAAAIECLAGRGATVNVPDRERLTPLALASDQACWDAVRALIAAGAGIEGGDGVKPLHLAAMADGDDPVGAQLLLAAGEPVDARGKLGRTALMGAAMKGNALVVNALLEAGADVDAQDDFGNTALMEAARAGANPVLERLVFWKPETEFRDKPGRTALLVAVSSRRADADTIRLLLAMGADPDVENRDQRPAGELAAAAGRWQMARALGVLVRTGQHEPIPASAVEQPRDGPRVIDLKLFETEDDVAWATRQFASRSRTELDAAAPVVPEEEGEAEPAQEVPVLELEPPPPFEEGDLDSVVDIELDPGSLDEVGHDEPAVQVDELESLELPLPPPEDLPETVPEPLPELLPELLPEPPPELSPEQELRSASRTGLETLLSAALQDDIERMQMVLDHEEDVPMEWFVQAFQESVRAGRGIAPRWLLEHGLEADATSADGVSLVGFAARLDPPNAEVIEMLLQRGASVGEETDLILVLCRSDHRRRGDEMEEDRTRSLLPLLAESGADIEALDGQGRSALHWAAEFRSREVVASLLELGARVDPVDVNGNSPLMIAVAGQRTGIVRQLLKHGANPRLTNQKGGSPLSMAMAEKDQTLARMLMSAAGNAEAATEEPGDRAADLIDAATAGNLGRVKRLVGGGTDCNVRDDQGCTPLLRAAGEGHVTVVETLLRAGADADLAAANGTTPLGAAVLGNHMHVVKLLCDRGVAADQRQLHGLTPLILASARWYPRIVSTLLRSEADPNARDKTDTTPLMAAVQNALGSDELDAGAATIKFLLRAGADVDVANDEGQTALMLLYGVRARQDAPADEANILRLAQALLDAGADLDRQDASGWCALHAAAAHGYRDAAALLMKAGASRRLRDINGLSPVDLAMERSHEDLVDLFIRSG